LVFIRSQLLSCLSGIIQQHAINIPYNFNGKIAELHKQGNIVYTDLDNHSTKTMNPLVEEDYDFE